MVAPTFSRCQSPTGSRIYGNPPFAAAEGGFFIDDLMINFQRIQNLGSLNRSPIRLGSRIYKETPNLVQRVKGSKNFKYIKRL